LKGLVGIKPYQVAPVVHAVVSGECVLDLNGELSIYEARVHKTHPAPGSATTYAAFRVLFALDSSDLAKSRFMNIEYDTAGKSDSQVGACLEQVKSHYQNLDILFDIIVAAECISAFVYKGSYVKMRHRLVIQELAPPTVYRLINPKGGGCRAAKQRQLDAFLARDSLPGEHFRNMHVKNAANIDADTGLSIAEQDLLAQVRSCLSNPASASRFQSALEHLLAEHAARMPS